MNALQRRLTLGASIVMVALLIVCNKTVPPEKKLEQAQVSLLQDCPVMNDMYNNIQRDGYRVTIRVGTLTGATEGSTWVSESEAVITIDVSRVGQAWDRLEPVLAHEIIHINDARYKFGMEKFISLVAAEKDLPWDQRTVEKSAIEQEDFVRRALLATGRYKGMAPSRREQNIKKGLIDR